MELDDLNVLYVEEALKLAEEIEEVLDGKFHDCYYGTTFEEAVRTFKDVYIDLIVANIDRPDLGAVKFIKIVKSKAAGFPVILLSRKEDGEVRKIMGAVEVDGIVRLPATRDEFAARVSGVKKAIVDFAETRKDRKKEKLERSLGVEESIDVYFKKIHDDLMRFDREKGAMKSMDFDIMKTFLYTAYNNFNAIDPRFDDEKMIVARKQLERAVKLKVGLERKVASTVEELYEVVFLRKRMDYLEMYEESEDVKVKLFKYRQELGILTRQMDEAKEKMKMFKPGTDQYVQEESLFKKCNAKHVDKVHMISEFKTRLEKLGADMDEIRKAHFEDFRTVFVQKRELLKAEIKEALDYLAYRFDKNLWRRAKTSHFIRDFFQEAQIKGLFSSKTYLEYYASHLDKDLAGVDNRKILKYLKDFNARNKIHVAVLGEEAEEVTWQKQIIEKIDPQLKATGFMDPSMLIKNAEKTDYELVILDYNLGRGGTAPEAVQKIRSGLKEKAEEMTFCVNLPVAGFAKAKAASMEAGVVHFIKKGVGREEYKIKLLEVL